jgi:hypothetical protein
VARSAGLVLRVVLVARAGAAEARRRVADVLLRAAMSRAASTDAAPPPMPANEPLASPSEKAA